MEDFSRTTSAPTLFDTLMLQRSSSIFFDYIRESKALSGRISDEKAQSTLLLPTNRAVIALGWKPHRGPPKEGVDGEVEISEAAGRENVERWLSAHLIPAADIDFTSPEPHLTLLDGKTITFSKVKHSQEPEKWKNFGVVQGEEVVHITQRLEACNGIIYVINGTITLS